VRKTHEIHRVSAIVIDLDEDGGVISLDDCAERSSGPAPGIREHLDDVKHVMSWASHHERLWQQVTGCPPKSRQAVADDPP
jgi:hypothetical protein